MSYRWQSKLRLAKPLVKHFFKKVPAPHFGVGSLPLGESWRERVNPLSLILRCG